MKQAEAQIGGASVAPSSARFNSNDSGTLLRRLDSLLPTAQRILIVLGIVLVFAEPHWPSWGDSATRYRTLVALAHGHLTSTRYAIVQDVLALPLYALGALVGHPGDATSFFNVLVFVGTLYWLHRLLSGVLQASQLRVFLLLLLSASMFPRHVEYFYSEVLTACCVFLGLMLDELGAERLGGVLHVVGVMNSPATLIGSLFVSVHRAWTRKQLLRSLWPTAVAAAGIAAENWIRRGSPLHGGYEGESFSTPLAFGLIGTLLSPGKGLLFFVPGLFLPLALGRAEIPDAVAVLLRRTMVFLVGLAAVYMRWWAWDGDWFWGPRFYLIACFPAALLLALAMHRPRRAPVALALVLMALLLSIWGAFEGRTFASGPTGYCGDQWHCDFLPWNSALVRPFIAHVRFDLQSAIGALYALCAAAVTVATVLVNRSPQGRTLVRLPSPPSSMRSAGEPFHRDM